MSRVRPELEIFAEKMEAEMRKNDKEKGESWKTCELLFLAKKLDEERGEVDICFVSDEENVDKTVEELVHEAILCMMLAYRILED